MAGKVRSHAPRPEGLEVLVPATPAETRDVDIVFVHGLGGHALKSWWHADSNATVPWIADPDFLGDIYDKARIMTFGYNADLRRKVSSHRVIDHANDLLEGLVEVRRQCQGRPLMFVAHSMGGLVVKKALILCHDDTRYDDILAMRRSVIFLGTPHEGSEQADNLQVLLGLASLLKIKVSDISEELETYSVTTMDINKSFMRNASRNLQLLCFYETVKTRLPQGDRLIVRESSAQLNGNSSQNVSMACAHSELSKFASPQDFRYKNIFFRKFRALLEDAIASRSEEEALEQPDPDDRVEEPQACKSGQTYNNPYPMKLRKFVAKTIQHLMIKFPGSETRCRRTQVGPNPFPMQSVLNLTAADVPRSFTLEELKSLSKLWMTDTAHAQRPQRPPIDERARASFLASLTGFTAAHLGQGVPSPHPGTCGWIDDHPVFVNDWISATQSRLLLITGDSGSGKSCLARHMRDQLRCRFDEPHMVLAFFCNSAHPDTKGSTEPPILTYFIKELISRSPELYRHVNEYRSLEHIPGNLSFAAQMDILTRIAKDPGQGKILLIIDGLDECGSEFATKLLRSIRNMLFDTSPQSPRMVNRLRIASISRPSPAIRPNVSDLHIIMATDDVETDIEKFVHESVHSLNLEADKTYIAEWITNLAGHSFLWAVSTVRQLEALNDSSRESISAMLQRCPRDMEEYYNQAVADLASTENSLGRHILRLILRAARPLTKSEVSQAVSLLMGHAVTGHDLEACFRAMSTKLIRVGSDGSLSLFHYSLREHLSSTNDFGVDHCQMLRACFHCIAHVADENPDDLVLLQLVHRDRADRIDRDAERDVVVNRLWRDYPFLDYAQQFLFAHAYNAGEEIVSCIPLLSRYIADDFLYHRWRGQVFLSDRLRSYGTNPPFLGEMARNDLRNLLQHTIIIEPISSKSWKGLHKFFSSYLNAKLCTYFSSERLILHASITEKGNNDNTLLHFAVGYEYCALDFATLYYNETQSVDPLTTNGITPLQSAAALGTPEGMELLLNWGADPLHSSGAILHSALQQSALVGNLKKLELILTKGLSNAKIIQQSGPVPGTIGSPTSAQDLEHARRSLIQDHLQPALLGAVAHGHVDAAILLSHYGAEASALRLVHLDSELARPALHDVMGRGRDEMFYWLLENGELPSIDEYHGQTALITALQLSRMDYADAIITESLKRGLHADCFDIATYPDRYTAVHMAVYFGTPHILRRLLDAGASANPRDVYGRTPLHTAVSQGNQEKIKLLLDHGSRLDVPGWRNNTPLSLACGLRDEESALEVVDILLASESNIRIHDSNSIDERDFSSKPLQTAAWHGYTRVITRLLEAEEVIDIDVNDGNAGNAGERPLYYAVCNNQLEAARLLLSQGASALDTWCLVTAVVEGNADMVSLLLSHGANIFATVASETALDVAIDSGNVEILKRLTDEVTAADIQLRGTKSGWHPLDRALQQGKRQCAMHLVRFCDNARPTDQRGVWPLLHAAQGGDVQLLRHLLYGQDWKPLLNSEFVADQGDLYGPLPSACFRGNVKAVKFLLEEGSDATITYPLNKFTSTALAACIESRAPRAVKIANMLLSYKSELWRYSQKHLNCALASAIQSRRQDMVQLLLSHGANPTAPYFFGMDETKVVFLIEEIIDEVQSTASEERPGASSTRTNTPLHLAVATSHADIVASILQNRDMDLSVEDEDGYTPLHLASVLGSQAIISLLLLGIGRHTDPTTVDCRDRLLAARNKADDTAFILRMGRRFKTASERTSMLHEALSGFDPDWEFDQVGDSVLATSDRLMALEDDALAPLGYQLAREWLHHVDAVAKLCDACDNMSTLSSMFICRRCEQIVLCETCYTVHLEYAKPFATCSSHAFLHVAAEAATQINVEIPPRDVVLAGEDPWRGDLISETQVWLDLVKAKYGFKSADGKEIKGTDRTVEIEAVTCAAPRLAVRFRPVSLTTPLLGVNAMAERSNNGADDMVAIEKVWKYVADTLREVEGWEYIDRLQEFLHLSEQGLPYREPSSEDDD